MKRQPRKTISTGKTICVLRFGHEYYGCPSASVAAKAADVLRKLQPLEYHYDGTQVYYVPKSAERRSSIGIDLDEAFEDQERREALPAPREGEVPCEHCQATVKPGNSCPGCGVLATLL